MKKETKKKKKTNKKTNKPERNYSITWEEIENLNNNK